jgi:hypothetical protein
MMVIDTQNHSAYIDHLVRDPDTDLFFETRIPFSNVDSVWLATEDLRSDRLDVDHALLINDRHLTRFKESKSDSYWPNATTRVFVPVALPNAEEIEMIRKEGLVQYTALKSNIRETHGVIVACGSVAYPVITGDTYSVTAFVCGSIVGAIYLHLLSKHVDRLGDAPSMRVQSMWDLLVSPLRMVIVAILSSAFIQTNDVSYLLPYTIGFFTYKVAVVWSQLNE